MRLIANISMLFTEVPLAARLEAARDAGFQGVEIQFPEDADIDPLRAAMERADLDIVLINVPRGPGDAVGLAALPGEAAAFRAAVAECAERAKRLGAAKVNVLAGRPPSDADPSTCRAVLKDNLIHAADRMAQNGIRVMVEPINPKDVPGFFLNGLAPTLEVLEEIGHPNLFLQFDLYHMAITEPDLATAIGQAGRWIGHVQFADTPGRHEPGSGGVDFTAALTALRGVGYDGELSAEYHPAGATTEGLRWMATFERMMA